MTRQPLDPTDPSSGGKPHMSTGSDLIAKIAGRQNLAEYQKKHWSGSFADYLDIVRSDPKVTRTAYQRVYDMILSHGTEEVIVNKEKTVRYKFFEDPDNHGPGRDLRPREDASEPGQHPQERREQVRDRAARAAARTGRSAAPRARSRGCSRRASSATRGPTRARSTPSAGARRRSTAARLTPTARCTRSRST